MHCETLTPLPPPPTGSSPLVPESHLPRHENSVQGEGTVLIVEDEAELSEILEYNLRKAGFTVFTAADGLSACRRTAEVRPDLILLDLMLPDLSGWEICKLIRAHEDEEIATTPIIMVTALGSLDQRLKGLELGADDYIPKPYSIKEILLKGRELVVKRRKVKALAAENATLRADFDAGADIHRMIFHEFRNQLVVLGGFSNLLARDHGEISPERSKSYAEAIQRSSQFLNTLAEEFLLLRHFQSRGLELSPEPLDLDRVVSETLLLYRPLLEEKEIRPEVEGGSDAPRVAGNYAATRLILSVLLENALKYGPRAAPLKVQIRSAGDRVELAVEDGGPGITSDELGRIFEKFYRGRDAARTTSGSGLGLYFGRTLAEAMGGTLEVTTASEGGSRFVLRLPRALRAA